MQIDADIDWDNIKLEDDEGNQKLVLKEFMKEKGFNSKQIEKNVIKKSIYQRFRMLYPMQKNPIHHLHIYRRKITHKILAFCPIQRIFQTI